jgi:uncharacterized protein (UPF0261 family)
MGKVYIAGTCDTKEAELVFARELVEKSGAPAVLVDVSTSPGWISTKADVKPAAVAALHPRTPSFLDSVKDRGAAVTAMGEALSAYLLGQRDLGGVLGLGGGGNTSIVTAAMRALPIGVPKLMVSTMASGNIAPYVGPSDIAMMYAVTDIAGLNAISRQVIGNAAHAIAAMATKRIATSQQDKPGVGLTMFGVTTACVTAIRSALEKSHECFVFHATGTGGQSMEKLADSGFLAGVIDITTTEVADHLCGGVLACTEDRFGAIIRTRLPYVGSVGALDMVNFGASGSVPSRFAGRRFHIHNPQVTLMRTTPEESRSIGEWIVARLNLMEGPVRFLLPLRGVSAIDAPGQPFHDPAADEALFAAIRGGWQKAKNRKLIEVDAHINDPAFAATAINAFKDIM